MSKVDIVFSVRPQYVAWLESHLAQYALPDTSKAMRCLLEYLMAEVTPAELATFLYPIEVRVLYKV